MIPHDSIALKLYSKVNILFLAMARETIKNEDQKNKDLDEILVDICEPGCIVSDEPVIDFEIEVIKRSKAVKTETPERNNNERRSSYSHLLEKAIRRINKYEKSLNKRKDWEKDEAAKGKARAKMMRLINIYSKIKEKYIIPPFRDLMVDDIGRSIYKMVAKRRGNERKTIYFKTIVRRLIMLCCIHGIFPAITRSRDGNEIISIRQILSELEELSRLDRDRRVGHICVKGCSCLRKIFKEVGIEPSDNLILIERIALVSSNYSNVSFDLVMEALKTAIKYNRDEMDVLNDLLAKRSLTSSPP